MMGMGDGRGRGGGGPGGGLIATGLVPLESCIVWLAAGWSVVRCPVSLVVVDRGLMELDEVGRRSFC